MNRRFKSLAFVGTSLATVLIAASPVAGVGRPVMAESESSSSFCTSLSNKALAISNTIDNLKGKVETAWSNQNTRLTTLATNTDQKIAADRAKADTAWQNAFAKLEAKATTDSEKTAVQAYETSVNQAIATRRSAYDAARTTFRSGVKNAITARQLSLGNQTNTFANSAINALGTAEASCNSGSGSAATTRTTLMSSLRSARQTFVNDRRSDHDVNTAVQQLAATRNAAFKAADQAFAASLKQAADTLKAAFGSQASSIE